MSLKRINAFIGCKILTHISRSSSVDNERALSAEHKSGGDSDCTAPNRSAEEKQRNLHESRESYEEEEGGLRVASSDGEHSSCDDLRNERQTADIRSIYYSLK